MHPIAIDMEAKGDRRLRVQWVGLRVSEKASVALAELCLGAKALAISILDRPKVES
jgi:hypothetical protein